MAGVKSYSSKKVVITANGVPITGFVDGSFVNVSPNSENVFRTVGADGEVSRSLSADNTNNVTITLQQTSLGNDILNGFAIADKLDGSGAFALSVADLSGRTIHFWPEAWVNNDPEEDFGTEVGERGWTIQTGQPAVANIAGN